MKVRDFGDSFSGSDRDFVILAKATGVVDPAKCTLNDPSPGKLFPLVRLDFYRNIYAKAEDFVHIQDESTAIACVGTKLLNERVLFERKCPRNCVSGSLRRIMRGERFLEPEAITHWETSEEPPPEAAWA